MAKVVGKDAGGKTGKGGAGAEAQWSSRSLINSWKWVRFPPAPLSQKVLRSPKQFISRDL